MDTITEEEVIQSVTNVDDIVETTAGSVEEVSTTKDDNVNLELLNQFNIYLHLIPPPADSVPTVIQQSKPEPRSTEMSDQNETPAKINDLTNSSDIDQPAGVLLTGLTRSDDQSLLPKADISKGSDSNTV